MSTAWAVSPTEISSANLLKCIKTSETSCDDHLKAISKLKVATLIKDLPSQNERLAFWLNLYNALTQLKLSKNPKSYENKKTFFSETVIKIDRKELSLDDIEHGLIRSSRWKYGLGFIGRIFISDFEEKLRAFENDWRIHFALNCGAESCPPIFFYQSDKLDQQLDRATDGFLQNDIIYLPEKNLVKMSSLFSWFRGDFGKRAGILKLLKDRELLPKEAGPDFHYKKYDWTLAPRKY